MQAIILSVGDELALGQTVDTNSAWLSQQLARLGIPTRAHETIADDLPLITQAIEWAAWNSDLVLISGGIGPTDDDLTRQALADAMKAELVEDPAAIQALQAFFTGRGREMPSRNRVQALHPTGSTTIANACGTAPGICATLYKSMVYVTPGVPREMKEMYRASIEPQILAHGGVRPVILTTKINTFGTGESNVAEMLGDLMDRDRNPKVGTTVANGICSVRVRAEFADADQARQQLDDTVAQIGDRLGPIVFGRDEQTLQSALVDELAKRGKTVATAESCTGGLVGAMITDVPGSSEVYAGGWTTYANAMKTDQLGVDAGLIERHGAVSEPVAIAMARGAIEHAGTDHAVAVTGIAGPDGGTPDKPVGAVWIALATPHDAHALLLQLPGTRSAIRDRAAKAALQLLRLQVLDQPLSHLSWAIQPTMKP